jgi:3-dehydroquinate synthase
MITLDLTLPDTRYPIQIGHGLLDQVELILPHLPIPQVAIVTNDVVAPLYLERLTRQLQSHGVHCIPVVLPDGEANKNWQTLNLIRCPAQP